MLIYFKDIIFFRSIKERRNAYFGVASARGKNWNILLALFQNKWFRGFYIWTTHLISIILVRFFLGHGQLLPSFYSYQSLLLYLFLNFILFLFILFLFILLLLKSSCVSGTQAHCFVLFLPVLFVLLQIFFKVGCNCV